MIKLNIGAVDITKLAPTVTWSGDVKQCSRTLDFGILSSPTDKTIPVIDCPLGAPVSFAESGTALFDGYIVTRTKSTDGSVIDTTAYDRGFYIKRNKASYKFQGMTPEAIAGRVAADFGIEVGALAQTGVKISRIFVGVTLYQIIQTAYTEAAKKTGTGYLIRFVGRQLTVVELGANTDVPLIAGGVNLQSASVTESITDMVNRVQITDTNGKVIDTVKNDSLIQLYGVLQEQIKQTDGQDARADAQKLLDDNQETQKITVNNLGDIRCVAGNAVAVQEPYTGLVGLFYIDTDTHTWKNGVYLNKLVLNFRRMMDEQEAGEVITAAGKGKNGAGSTGSTWQYINKPGG